MLNLDYLRFKLQRQGVTTVRVQLRKYNGSSYDNHVQADVSADGQHSVSLSTDGSSKFQVRIFSSTFGSGNYFTLDDFTLSKDSACQIYWSQDTGVYRFGFNGIEKYDELNGIGNSYDFGARIYDGRLGRWLSVDPLQKKYASLAPFVFAGCSPITFYDAGGKEIVIYYFNSNNVLVPYKYTPGVKPTINNDFVNKVHEAITYNLHTNKGVEVWSQLHTSDGVLEIFQQEATDQNGTGTNKFTPGGSDKTKDGKRLIGTIKWDPNSSIYTQDDDGAFITGILSPSTALLHEAGHGQRYDNEQKHGKQTDYNDDAYENEEEYGVYYSKEEYRCITKVEIVYIKQINKWEQDNNPSNPSYQPIRTNHHISVIFWDNGADVNLVDSSTYLLHKTTEAENGRNIDDGIQDKNTK